MSPGAGGGGQGEVLRADLDLVATDEPLGPKVVGSVVLLARTPADLRRVVSLAPLLPKAAQARVVVAESPVWRPPPVPAVGSGLFWRRLVDGRVGRTAEGWWRVEVAFTSPVPAGEVLRGLVRGLDGTAPVGFAPDAPVGVVALAGPGSCHWRPGDPNVTVTPLAGPVPDRRAAPGCDLSLRAGTPVTVSGTTTSATTSAEGTTSAAATTSVAEVTTAGTAGTGWPGSGLTPDDLPPVDERSTCPIGFVPVGDAPVGELVARLVAYEVVSAGEVLARVPLSGALTDADVVAVRGLAGVAVDLRRDWPTPLGVARVVCALAAAGVPLLAVPGPEWAAVLGEDLAALLHDADRALLADDLRRELYSIRLRRAALTRHGAAARWERLAATGGLGPPRPPTVSVLLCTRRPEMVRFALDQVRGQRGVETEVILALHGFPADHPEVAPAVAGYPGELTVLEADARLVFGAVLNQAAARARGDCLAKMDDDDWYGPGHLADLLLARRYAAADLVGCAPEFVHLEQIGVTVWRDFRTEAYRRIVAGGTILLDRAAFAEVGGFRPIPRTVDGQLLEAISSAGGRIYRTHGFNYVLRRRAARGHTWQEPLTGFLRSFRRQWRGLYTNPLMEPAGHADRQGRKGGQW